MTKDNNLLGKFNLEGIPPMPRGQPQIEVTFDIDANGILNVKAVEKSKGISNNIQIKNEKGRLSKDEIDRLVQEAESFKEEDEKMRKKVDAKNQLESLLYSGKSSVSDENAKKALDANDIKAVTDKADELLAWLGGNPNADESEYTAKTKEFEAVLHPIMAKLQPQGGEGGMPGGMPGGFPGGMPGGMPGGFPGGMPGGMPGGQQQQGGNGPQGGQGPNIEEVDD